MFSGCSFAHFQGLYMQSLSTCTIAGSGGRPWWDLGASHSVMSLISLPRKVMYSKMSSLGGVGLSVGRPSVPKHLTRWEKAVGKKKIMMFTSSCWQGFTHGACTTYLSPALLWSSLCQLCTKSPHNDSGLLRPALFYSQCTALQNSCLEYFRGNCLSIQELPTGSSIQALELTGNNL